MASACSCSGAPSFALRFAAVSVAIPNSKGRHGASHGSPQRQFIRCRYGEFVYPTPEAFGRIIRIYVERLQCSYCFRNVLFRNSILRVRCPSYVPVWYLISGSNFEEHISAEIDVFTRNAFLANHVRTPMSTSIRNTWCSAHLLVANIIKLVRCAVVDAF